MRQSCESFILEIVSYLIYKFCEKQQTNTGINKQSYKKQW